MTQPQKMGLYEFYNNMYDIRLKPRLLRSLTKDNLPDENQPFPNPSTLSNIVETIKTHALLSETIGSDNNNNDSVDDKFFDKWKSAVDSWVEKLLLLISNKMPDKCWAGICLLGVTCQECSMGRFLDSYSVWFQKLLPLIQQPSDSQFVKVASCASLSDMFTRLSGTLSVKKDGASLAGKLVQPVLNLLTEDSSVSVWEGAVDLFSTISNFFPTSVNRHYDSAEAVIVSKIKSGKCNTNLSKKFAYSLAMLPKTRGDEDSWSLMMQKILIFINVQLIDAFEGLEEETKSREAMTLLVQPGKDPPPPLGGCDTARGNAGKAPSSGEASNHAAERSEQLLFYKVSTLMQCCSMMLTNPYPVQVSVPVRPLLATVRRVLSVDGSSSQALLAFMTVLQQEKICSELPLLHLNSLDLLTSIIKGLRSQLLPNAADVIRLVTEYFRRCKLPALRIKLYSILQILLISMGVGMALYLAQEVINNAFVDLETLSHGSGIASSTTFSKPGTYALQQPRNKKRKHATLTGSAADHQNGAALEKELPTSKPPTPISVQIAALQALEALLTVGGALRSEGWRSNVDFLLITVATSACEGGWASEERTASLVSGEPTPIWADLQLAALHGILASLLSPTRSRPRYLSQGLELFRRGKQETGTKLAEFCAHALLALEVLIHPRALPLADSLNNCGAFDEALNHKFPENPFSSAQKHSTPFSRGVLSLEPDPDDDLYESWLGNGDEIVVPISNTDKNMECSEEPSEKHGRQTNVDPLGEQLAADGSISTVVGDEGRNNEHTGSMDVERGVCTDELMVNAERSIVPNVFGGVGNSEVMVPTSHTGTGEKEMESAEGVSDGDALDTNNSVIIPDSVVTATEAASNKGATSAIDDESPLDELASINTSSTFGKGKELISEDVSDTDSFPDIIDADPDSNSESDNF
ncbi:hypothetical protein IFM89_001230 [Coptis chinensis]|uniref:Pre-rRNA-processing protein RIX1 N-terminal domain-containing protein n=1 Tax=Coptis chinensis TaxID=261450 RepID=A0A835H0G4_9MAGN|nr:hypothetical protein IFM89_001230 [Coptis chinensis]